MQPRTLSAGDWLEAYEQLPLQPAWRWPAVLIALAYGGVSVEEAVTLPLPWREGLLLQLRRQNFGTSMRGKSLCPACGSDNEITLDCNELATAFPNWETLPESMPHLTELPSGAKAELVGLTAIDWAEAAQLATEESAVLLQERSLKSLQKAEHPIDWQSLDEADQVALSQALENLNGGLRLEVICSACGNKENREMDLGLWLAQEVSRMAQGILREVDLLARTYGWSERDILNLSPMRRRLYLEMAA